MSARTVVSAIFLTALLAEASGSMAYAGEPAAPASPAATSAPLDLSFDQIDRGVDASSTPPPPSAFSDEVAAAQNSPIVLSFGSSHSPRINTLVAAIPILGPIIMAIQAASEMHSAMNSLKQQQAMMRRLQGFSAPLLAHYSFLNGLARIDFGNLSIIIRPDQNRTIVLNRSTSQYRTMSAVLPTYDVSALFQSRLPSSASQGGTAIGQATVSVATSGSAAVQGVTADGYTIDATVTLTQSDGACHDGTFRAKELTYYTSMPEPLRVMKEAPADALALPDGCDAYMNRQVTGSVPGGQMYLYRLITVQRENGASPEPSSSATRPSNYYLVSQRGNFRPLSAADASLFDIPDGYQQLQQ